MALTDTTIKNAKPRDKAYKLYDSAGLYLSITPAGGKLWRFKFVFGGKELLLSLGSYPEISLKGAREKRDAARQQVAEGKSPTVEKKRAAVAATINAATTFDAVAEEFIDKRAKEGLADVTISKSRWLVSLLSPAIGSRAVADIEPFELLSAIRKIEAAGNLHTAKRALELSGRIFLYAIATARARNNPARDLRGALRSATTEHHAAILDKEALGTLLRAIDAYGGQPATVWALKIAPHVFLRPGELRKAKWEDIDFESGTWRVPVEVTKMRREDHFVPISRQVRSMLIELRPLSGRSDYLFPATTTPKRCMSENTVNQALRRMGFSGDEMTAHGFRSTASTMLNESGKWTADAVERALSHKIGGVRGVYHRGKHWIERVEMAQWWSDHLDVVRTGAEVIHLKGITA